MDYDNDNELSYDENYCLQYYTVQDFMNEYPDDYITDMLQFWLDTLED